MITIALDAGASFLKGALFQDGALIRRSIRQAPAVNVQGHREPRQIFQLLCAVQEMILELAGDEREITLVIASEMHGFLLADEAGKPLTEYISWQCEWGALPLTPAGDTALRLLAVPELAEAVKKTGMPLRAGLPSVNLLYLLRQSGPWQSGAVYFYTLGDFLLRALSGSQPEMHVTQAAGTGLYDLEAHTWNRELITTIGSDRVLFPEVGEQAVQFLWNGKHITAYPALGDQQAALFGADFLDEDEISFNLGTGAQVSRLTQTPSFPTACQLRPYLEGSYLLTLPHLPSGRALNVYFRFVRQLVGSFASVSDEDLWAYLLREAEQADESAMECDLSFFANPLTTHERGSLRSIGEYDLTPGKLMRTIFRQMAVNFRQAADIVSVGASPIRKLVFSGGVARRCSLLRQMLLQSYDHGVEKSVAKDETLWGLYRYACRGAFRRS